MERTTCCIVGGGPGGAMLALLLARRGVNITLLEMHQDFDREFRGDTIHPSTMEILDQIGLADKLHEIPHTKVSGPTLQFANGSFRPFDLGRLKTRFPYILMVPQSRFLEFLTHEAAQYPHFKLRMHAQAQHLLVEENGVRGVRYLASDGPHEIRARLTVGADGRVVDCTVTSSSGTPELDDATCKNVSRRARFKPAMQDGQPVQSTYSNRIRWVLPE